MCFIFPFLKIRLTCKEKKIWPATRLWLLLKAVAKESHVGSSSALQILQSLERLARVAFANLPGVVCYKLLKGNSRWKRHLR